MADFCMPSLGADMDRGTVTQWLVAPGDTVRRGDIVAIVETDKADVEVEVYESGIIEELLVPEGTEVDVGTPLARIDATPAESAPATPAPATPAPAKPAPASERRERVSPRARRIAAERGVDTSDIGGTGPGGAITGRDLEHATPRPAEGPVKEPAPADRSASMRSAIARAMARSKREIPHYYLAADIDFSRARAFLDERNSERPVTERVLPAALLLRATALAVRETPEVNGFWVDDTWQPSDAVHVGVAISLRAGGLVAPAIHDADGKDLDELMAALRDLVTRARAGRLRASEISDSTITVTNLGDHRADLVHGVIYPPQVALVGFGVIRERPWAADGMLGVRPVVTATLAADHRASDGARGARLLELIDGYLQQPEEL